MPVGQILLDKAKDDLNEELVRKNHEISKVLDKAANGKTNSRVVETNLNQQLSGKSTAMKHITAESSYSTNTPSTVPGIINNSSWA